MDEYLSLGDTRYVFRNSKFVLLTFNILRIALAFCYLQISLAGQKKRTFDVFALIKICKYGMRVQLQECQKWAFEWLY